MPRTGTPDGKSITVTVKVSASQASLIDAARGKITRSAWLQKAIGVALSEKSRREALAAVDAQLIERARAGARPESRSARTTCPHPPARVHGGLCGACGTGGLAAAKGER